MVLFLFLIRKVRDFRLILFLSNYEARGGFGKPKLGASTTLVRGHPLKPLPPANNMEAKEPKKQLKTIGRPKKGANKKDKRISFATTTEEYEQLTTRAAELKITVAEYCHKMVHSGKVVDVYSDVTKKDRAVLYGLANNVNQLAYKANVGNYAGMQESLDNTITKIYAVLDKYYDNLI